MSEEKISLSQETPFLLRRHAFNNGLVYFYGPERFDEHVEFLGTIPFLLFIEIFFIGVPILLHAVIGIYIWIFGLSNVQHYGYLRNWLYSLQRWSGIVAIIFILYHVYKLRIEWTFKTDLEHITTGYIREYFRETWHVLFYFVGVSAATFHFANGIWNFLIKWGITVGERAQKYSGYICALIGLGVYVFFITSLYAFTR